MTDTNATSTDRQAVEILTSIARQTRTRGAGTPSEATEPIDFADAIAQVLTVVAANVGGVETLLAGRSGSWEADLVRGLVEGTAGDELLRWRTEPVRLYGDAECIFMDFGIADLFDQADEQAVNRTQEADLTDEQVDAAEAVVTAIDRLWEQDKAAYATAFLATAQRYLVGLGGTCGVEIVPTAPGAWDGLAEQIHEYARQHTPLPMTGSAPDWSCGTPADALRRAGLTYTARLEQLVTARLDQLAGEGDRS